MKPILEVCTDSLESVRAARNAGAARVELCSGLSDGGLTPSLGLLNSAAAMGIPVNVLIRQHPGDFIMTHEDVDIAISDIHAAAMAGASGVVIGALTPDGDIDIPACRRLIEAAKGLSVTFHRAFDLCKDPFKALEEIIAMGCDRILTSGQAHDAESGIGLIAELIKMASDRIIIMPGCGINPSNARKIMDATGATELHASCRAPFPSAMRYRKDNITMGSPDVDEYIRMTASEDIIKKILES